MVELLQQSFDEYIEIDAINASRLKRMGTSPLAFAEYESAQKKTAAMTLGSAAHKLILEPSCFSECYAIWTGSRRAGQKWKDFLDANAGREIINSKEHRQICNMRDAIEQHSVANSLLSGGRSELTLQWTDADTDVKCKGRIDYLNDYIVDLKTTIDNSPRAFASQSARLGYHISLAFYQDGLKRQTGISRDIKIVTVQSVRPWDVVVYNVPEDIVEAGRERYKLYLQMLVQCNETNRWPGQFDNEIDLDLPVWAQSDPLDDIEWDDDERDHDLD